MTTVTTSKGKPESLFEKNASGKDDCDHIFVLLEKFKDTGMSSFGKRWIITYQFYCQTCLKIAEVQKTYSLRPPGWGE